MRTQLTLGLVSLALTASAQWTAVPSGTLTQLEDVLIANPQLALACGKDGILLRSLDGGSSWTTTC